MSVRPIAEINIDNHGFEMRLARPDQAPEIFTLVCDAYAKEATRLPNVGRYSKVQEVADLIQRTDKIEWLVLQPKDTAEVMGSLQIARDDSKKYSLNAFAINPKYKELQLGGHMLNEAIKYLESKKITEVFLNVISVAQEPLEPVDTWKFVEADIKCERNTLADYYERQGFTYTGFIEIPPMKWQKETRREEFHGKVIMKEMKVKGQT